MTKYHVVHNNQYSFSQPVKHCALEARLKPLDNKKQTVEFSQFVVRPLARSQRCTKDEFANQVNYFEITRGLQSFMLTAIHTVSTFPLATIDLVTSLPWEQVAGTTGSEANLYQHDSTSSSYVKTDAKLAAYTAKSFVSGRPLLEAAFDLMRRIHEDFLYDPAATNVATTAIQAFDLRRGVCQDFTHIAIACLRSLRIPVRYVSGYVDTKTVSSKRPHKIAADVSHAWFSVYDPEYGWVDFDPTNNSMPGETYVSVACGRDYNDVAPLKGQVDSQGENRLKVSVDMTVLG